MSQKLKHPAILAISMAIVAYMVYKALIGLSDAFDNNDDVWDDINE